MWWRPHAKAARQASQSALERLLVPTHPCAATSTMFHSSATTRPTPVRCKAAAAAVHDWLHMVMVFSQHEADAYMHQHTQANVLVADDEGTEHSET